MPWGTRRGCWRGALAALFPVNGRSLSVPCRQRDVDRARSFAPRAFLRGQVRRAYRRGVAPALDLHPRSSPVRLRQPLKIHVGLCLIFVCVLEARRQRRTSGYTLASMTSCSFSSVHTPSRHVGWPGGSEQRRGGEDSKVLPQPRRRVAPLPRLIRYRQIEAFMSRRCGEKTELSLAVRQDAEVLPLGCCSLDDRREGCGSDHGCSRQGSERLQPPFSHSHPPPCKHAEVEQRGRQNFKLLSQAIYSGVAGGSRMSCVYVSRAHERQAGRAEEPWKPHSRVEARRFRARTAEPKRKVFQVTRVVLAHWHSRSALGE